MSALTSALEISGHPGLFLCRSLRPNFHDGGATPKAKLRAEQKREGRSPLRPHVEGRFPCSREYFPCYSFANSLLRCVGERTENAQSTGLFAVFPVEQTRDFQFFPVIFPDSREFPAETGSRVTASSASQSGLCGPFPACSEKPEVLATLRRLQRSLRSKKATTPNQIAQFMRPVSSREISISEFSSRRLGSRQWRPVRYF
jgi:hypothetical protein